MGKSTLYIATVFLHCHFNWNISVHHLHHYIILETSKNKNLNSREGVGGLFK